MVRVVASKVPTTSGGTAIQVLGKQGRPSHEHPDGLARQLLGGDGERWVFQRSLHKRTHNYVGVQQSMSLFLYDWGNDKNTPWVEVDQFINDPTS